ncbi:hypothetical protein HPB47_003476, partial [Ixodes persulcatus]
MQQGRPTTMAPNVGQLSRFKEDQMESSHLLETVQSNKVAASRGLIKSKELKRQAGADRAAAERAAFISATTATRAGDPFEVATTVTQATRTGAGAITTTSGQRGLPHPLPPLPATATSHRYNMDGADRRWTAWEEQPRPERGEAYVIAPEPFRALTLEDRHPNDPSAQYTGEERRLLCPLCGVPELARETHRAGLLHVNRLQNHDELQRAIDVVRRRRLQLLRSNDHDEN